ncbi:unnamed protein product [Arabidopsis halleri]
MGIVNCSMKIVKHSSNISVGMFPVPLKSYIEDARYFSSMSKPNKNCFCNSGTCLFDALAVNSSKHGTCEFPSPGNVSPRLGNGVRNDVAKKLCWVEHMREWGPTIAYDSASEINKIMNLLPLLVGFSLLICFSLIFMEKKVTRGQRRRITGKEMSCAERESLCVKKV